MLGGYSDPDLQHLVPWSWLAFVGGLVVAFYTAPEFYVYSGFDQIDEVSFSLADSDGTIIDTWTAYPSDFTPSDGGGMVYFVNLDGASVDEECYTLYATWTTTDMSSGMTQRDDICFDRTESTDDSYIDDCVGSDLLGR